MRAGAVGLAAWLLLGCAAEPARPTASPARTAAPVFLDFSFVAGVPVAGTRLTACGRMTVASTNTERHGSGSFRNAPSGDAASVTLSFDRPIRALELGVSSVRSDEFLADFSVGSPERLSGTLTQRADGRVTTARPFPADDGAGTLAWLRLDTPQVKFTVACPPKGAIAVDRFSVACAP